jgi:hypothetical protein
VDLGFLIFLGFKKFRRPRYKILFSFPIIFLECEGGLEFYEHESHESPRILFRICLNELQWRGVRDSFHPLAAEY